MRCDKCHGTGVELHHVPKVNPMFLVQMPCPVCGGSGIAHCCDGLTSANDVPEPDGDAE